MKTNKILIIDNDQSRAQELKIIFDFVEETATTVNNENWQSHGIAKEQLLAIVLGDCGNTQNFVKLVVMLNECYPLIPMLLIKDTYDLLSLDEKYQSKFVNTITLPLNNQMLTMILKDCERYQEKQAVLKMKNTHRDSNLFRNLVGMSRTIRQARQEMEKILDAEGNIFIQGEHDTGKEVWARNLHYFSNRRIKPFVALQCSAIAQDALETELFGNTKTSELSTNDSYPGCLELANGGTLFINDIELLPAHVQQKLATALKEKKSMRTGENNKTDLDIRIVAASEKDLVNGGFNGEFNPILLEYIHDYEIKMPALKDRLIDLPLLINELVDHIEAEEDKTLNFAPEAIDAMQHYQWPGNLRELSTLVRSLMIDHPNGIIQYEDLPDKIREVYDPSEQTSSSHACVSFVDPSTITMPESGLNLKEYLAQTEVAIIQQSLKQCKGVITHAAKLLHMRRTTLVEKMRKYGLRETNDKFRQ